MLFYNYKIIDNKIMHKNKHQHIHDVFDVNVQACVPPLKLFPCIIYERIWQLIYLFKHIFITLTNGLWIASSPSQNFGHSHWHYQLQTTRINLPFCRDIQQVEDLVDSYVALLHPMKNKLKLWSSSIFVKVRFLKIKVYRFILSC